MLKSKDGSLRASRNGKQAACHCLGTHNGPSLALLLLAKNTQNVNLTHTQELLFSKATIRVMACNTFSAVYCVTPLSVKIMTLSAVEVMEVSEQHIVSLLIARAVVYRIFDCYFEAKFHCNKIDEN